LPHINKQMASFFLTTKCNLRCVYCYNIKERAAMKEQSLPLHIAKAGVESGDGTMILLPVMARNALTG